MLIFDYDGVIADSLELCTQACRAAAAGQGVAMVEAEDLFSDLEPLTFEALARRLDVQSDRFVRDVTAQIAAHSKPSPIFADMARVLEDLSARVDVAVLSASASDVISRFLAHHGIDAAVSTIVGGDTPGGKPKKLAALISGREDRPHVMIGDGSSDVAAATSAGIPCVGVAWGWQPAARLKAAGADTIAATPEDLEAILHRMMALDS